MNQVSRETPSLSSVLIDEAYNATNYKIHGLTPLASLKDTRIISVANQKGGVGKTTSTVNLAYALAKQNLKVLIIDFDPQGNASTALKIDKSTLKHTSYHLITGDYSVNDLIIHPDNPHLHIIPTDINLSGAEIELVTQENREYCLKNNLMPILNNNHYDFVFIDSPPSLGLLTINALVAATEILIPIQCEYYALEGVSQLMKSINLVRENLNAQCNKISILLTMYDGRTKLSEQVYHEVEEFFSDQMLRTTIPRSVKLAEAPSYGLTILEYDPGSTGARAYVESSQELYAR